MRWTSSLEAIRPLRCLVTWHIVQDDWTEHQKPFAYRLTSRLWKQSDRPFLREKKILCDNILFQTQKLLVLYPDNCNRHLFRCLVTWHIVQAVSGQNIRKLTSRLWRRSNQLCMKPSEKRHSLRQHRKFKLRNFCTLSRPLKLAELQLFPLLHISTTKRRFSHCGNMRCFNKTHRMNPWYGYDTSLCK